MCGIIGVVGKSNKSIDVDGMLDSLGKRGPDDRGILNLEGCSLGQTRLSIIDLSTGHQPIEDSKYNVAITFNGEIYNYKELREKLKAKGHMFKTESDTEVILKSYIEYGKQCPEHLDGMFAFAIWDKKKKELFIARDRFGKKPFYYMFSNGVFIFGSEIKAILKGTSVKGDVDRTALVDYFRHGYISPDKTIYTNINVLLPGYSGIVKNGSITTQSYWNLVKRELNVSYEEAKKEIENLFNKAVKKRMVADVEIGSLLSGGVDSTIVTHYAQQYSDSPIKTFSIGYEGYKNELPYAEEASKKIKTDHHSLTIKANLKEELEKVISYMDEPHADSSNFPQHMISKLASSKVKVVLTGDGADELFMGYGWYQTKWHMQRWRIDWKILNPFQAHQRAITIFGAYKRRKLLIKPTKPQKSFEKESIKGLSKPFHKINAYDLKVYLPGQLLSKIDQTSMMHSLEARAPFLDTELAEYVYNLPSSFKISKTQNKIILKDLLSETFPKEFVYRKKQGFGAPINIWMREEKMIEYIKEILEADNPMYKFINKKEALAVRDSFYKGSRRATQQLWLLLVLGIWFNKHQHDFN